VKAGAADAAEAIRAAIARMPEIDRQIFELCLESDLTYKEAAFRLGVTHATVRNRLSRLKRALRVELDLLRGTE